MFAGHLVLAADNPHAGLLQRKQLFFGRAFPQSDVGIDPSLLVAHGVVRILKPYGNREELRIFPRLGIVGSAFRRNRHGIA
jgi:hypothetical protein